MSTTAGVYDCDIEIQVEFSNGSVPYSHPSLTDVDGLIRQWFVAVPLKSFLFQESATPGVWRYEFEHDDGRKWKQKINFNTAPVDDPLMDFSGDFWRQSEFAAHRMTRDRVILLHNQFQVSKIEATRP